MKLFSTQQLRWCNTCFINFTITTWTFRQCSTLTLTKKFQNCFKIANLSGVSGVHFWKQSIIRREQEALKSVFLIQTASAGCLYCPLTFPTVLKKHQRFRKYLTAVQPINQLTLKNPASITYNLPFMEFSNSYNGNNCSILLNK